MEKDGIDSSLIQKILDRGNDVWIKRTKKGVAVLEVGWTRRQEIELRPPATSQV